MRLAPVDCLEEKEGVSLVFEIYKIFIVAVNPNISVGAPSSLDLLSGHLVLCFQLDLLFSLNEPSPRPLNLDGSNVVHSKTVVFEQASRKGHFISCLDNGRAEVSEALILIFMHDIEGRGQKLLSQRLSS